MEVEGAGDEVVMGQSLRISSRSGRVEVAAEERDDIVVDRGGSWVRVGVDAGEPTTVSSRSDALRLRVPTGTDLVVGTVSGRVKLTGALGAVAVTTMSGRLTVESAARLEVRTVSGRVEVHECRGESRVDSVSGRVEIGRTVGVRVSTKTGRVTVAEALGEVRVRSVVGRISIEIAEGPVDVRLETVSGRIDVTVPAGSTPHQRFAARSGSIRSSVPEGGLGEIAARTISGAIRVREA